MGKKLLVPVMSCDVTLDYASEPEKKKQMLWQRKHQYLISNTDRYGSKLLTCNFPSFLFIHNFRIFFIELTQPDAGTDAEL